MHDHRHDHVLDEWSLRAVGSMCSAVAVAGMLVAGAPSAKAEIPEALENIVFGDEKRRASRATVNGTAFDALSTFSAFPYLMWLADSTKPAPFPRDPAVAEDWLDRAAPRLGYDGFEARFKGRSSWRTNEVWTYELLRQELPLHDARLEVHWDQGTFLGIVIHTPGRIAAIEDLAVPAGEEWVYYPVRTDRGEYRVLPARVERIDRADRVEVSIAAPGGPVRRVVQKDGGGKARRGAMFEEFQVPSGTFPDQISVDEDGIIWFSQPNNNVVTEFDSSTGVFTSHASTGGSGPDGLIVGTQGRVWTGLYFSGHLGLFDVGAQTFHSYPAPYGSARMAIPVETSDGRVWVTDHERNRISEFDPVTETYLQSVIMPTGSCWVVQGYEDTDHGFIYFTEYNANQLGKIAVGGSSVTDIPTPGGGPAFCVYDDGKVYYSRWTEAGIGAYDVESGDLVEYEFPVSGELGGPMWLTPGGLIVTGTRNRGYIMVFDPDTETTDAYEIPTGFPGLKDGLTVAADGAIWFTESGANKLGKLVLASPICPGDVDGNGSVDTADLQAVLGAWGACGACPEDLDGSGVVDFGDLLILLASWGPCP